MTTPDDSLAMVQTSKLSALLREEGTLLVSVIKERICLHTSP